MKNKSFLKKIFYSLIIIFVLLITYFLISFLLDLSRIFFLLLLILGLTFLILGIILIVLAKKEKRKLKLFLMLTGISAISPFVFSILHNLFYGLSIAFENFKYLFEALHVASFIISLIVAPLAFIIGVIGSIILFNKKK
jgi:hypothetical protein